MKDKLINLLADVTNLDQKEISQLLEVPPNQKLGDYSFPCFKFGKNPKDAAEQLAKNIPKSNFISNIKIVGPYINFYLNQEMLSQDVLTTIFEEKKNYAKQNLGDKKIIVMDYSAPNIAKPFGIGHLRSTIIGNSLYRIFYHLGYKPISVNYLGDWGTQFGKLIVAYKKWGNKKELEKDPIKYLLSLYVRFHNEAELNTSLNEEARQTFKKLEDGDKESLALWETFKSLSIDEFERVYKIIDVTFDTYDGEAFINEKIDDTIKELKEKIKTKISDDALIVDLEKYNMSAFMLRKSDGATTYHSRDFATILHRIRHYKADKLLYIVGQEQKLHFKQLFKVAELFGFNKEKFYHAEFGHFRFPEGKMSTRKGQVIFLEEVLDKAISLAKKIIEEKNPGLENKEAVAKVVGVGSIIFGDLSNDRVKNIDFDWDRMLNFEGETGPYLQYTHARACSILRKSNKNVTPRVNFSLLNTEQEKKVITILYNFSDILKRVIKSYKPHHLAQYLISLAQAFNEFYHACPVITDNKELEQARLLLVDSVRQILENGLYLLGIQAPKEM